MVLDELEGEGPDRDFKACERLHELVDALRDALARGKKAMIDAATKNLELAIRQVKDSRTCLAGGASR